MCTKSEKKYIVIFQPENRLFTSVNKLLVFNPLPEANLRFCCILILRQLRYEGLGQQPAQRPAAASQKPGGGYSGGHPQHHP